jgi:hypothetical protein
MAEPALTLIERAARKKPESSIRRLIRQAEGFLAQEINERNILQEEKDLYLGAIAKCDAELTDKDIEISNLEKAVSFLKG